jgi:hypothetical protein
MYSICRGINHGDEIGMVDVAILPEHVQGRVGEDQGIQGKCDVLAYHRKGTFTLNQYNTRLCHMHGAVHWRMAFSLS